MMALESLVELSPSSSTIWARMPTPYGGVRDCREPHALAHQLMVPWRGRKFNSATCSACPCEHCAERWTTPWIPDGSGESLMTQMESFLEDARYAAEFQR